MPRKTDKRIRLIEAAKVLIHQQGFNLTTLADIAQEADVPLGNVYYYFKTKEAIGIAVIERRAGEWSELLANWSQETDPLARLQSWMNQGLVDIEVIARYGCPIGGLCQELGKQGGPLADLAAKLLHDVLQWTEQQFREMGVTEKAADLSLHLVSSMQGIYLMTHTFKDPKLAIRQTKMMQEWIEGLVGRKFSALKKQEAVAMAD